MKDDVPVVVVIIMNGQYLFLIDKLYLCLLFTSEIYSCV